MITIDGQRRPDGEGGFGLVEIVVSMFLIGLIVIAFLPLLVQGMVISARNVTLATATQLVNAELEAARSQPATCAALGSFRDAELQPVEDARGVELLAVRIFDECPAAADLPGTIRFTSEIRRTDDDTVVVAANTLILVGAA